MIVVEKMGFVLSNFPARERVGGCATRMGCLIYLPAELGAMQPQRRGGSKDAVEVVYGFSSDVPQSPTTIRFQITHICFQ